MNKPIGYFLGEGVLIVFSILVALGVNEWRERAGAEAQERQAAAAIHAEMADNLALLSELPAYHRAIATALEARIADAQQTGAGDARSPLEIFQGIEVLRDSIIVARLPQDVAWQLAKQRGAASRFDYDLARSLSLAYDGQRDGVVTLYAQVADALVRPEMFAARDQAAALAPLAAMFSELAAREYTLVEMLKSGEAQLREEYPRLNIHEPE